VTRLTHALLALTWLGAAAAEPQPPTPPTHDAEVPADTRAAEEAARAWLALVDDGRTDESWADATALFRQAVTKAQWADQVAGVRTALGKVLKRELRAAVPRKSLPGAPDGDYVVLQFDTTFEHKLAGVETVTPMRDPDGRWRVSGYLVR
jgi:hypothetical protein